MHLATRLRTDDFTVQIEGSAAAAEAVFADWNAHDRFGIVVADPFGALGASLLIQLAITRFYDHAPSRRSSASQYPEIYLFHLGGPHGDHSSFDFWPPRKEVRVPARAAQVLAAIQDRGITRLAVPDVVASPSTYVEGGPSGWTERASARERIVSAFAYSSSGDAVGGDLTLTGTAATIGVGPDVLAPDAVHATFSAMTDAELVAQEIGPSTAEDLREWLRLLGPRIDEVPASVRRVLIDAWAGSTAGGIRRETYRRVGADEALAMLADAPTVKGGT